MCFFQHVAQNNAHSEIKILFVEISNSFVNGFRPLKWTHMYDHRKFVISQASGPILQS